MSGRSWTPERKAAFAKATRERQRDPKVREAMSKRATASMANPTRRAAAAERMKLLNERMRTDKALKKKNIAGMKRTRGKKSFRAKQARIMTETMARPQLREKARQHACDINRDPEVRKRQWAGRRRKQQAVERKASEQKAPAAPKVAGDPNTIFLQLLAREARQAGPT